MLVPITSGAFIVLGMKYASIYTQRRWGTLTAHGDENALFAMLENISDAAQNAKTIDDVVKSTLTAICQFTNWRIGHAYYLNTNTNTSNSTNEMTASSSLVWHLDKGLDKTQVQDFIHLSEKTIFKPGIGLIGKVLKNKNPVTIKDVTRLEGFVRAEGARKNGVKGCFAFPIIYNKQAHIILEFFSRSAANMDEETLRVLSFTGKQLQFALTTLGHQADVSAMATNLQNTITNVVHKTEASVTSLKNTASALSTSFALVVNHTDTVHSNAHDTSDNVTSAADSVTQVTEAIKEISTQTADAKEMAQNCVQTVHTANEKSKQLNEAASGVQASLNCIQDIATQTNLLALNATIEAARAGEAGKGFAVVAHEVKKLANQSTQSAQSIESTIQSMLLAISEITGALENTDSAVLKISESSNIISAAAQRQSNISNDISDNMCNAASLTHDASEKISTIRTAVHEANDSTHTIENESRSMVSQTQLLRQLMQKADDFVKSVCNK